MQITRFPVAVLISAALFALSISASPATALFVPADQVIDNLEETLTQAKQQCTFAMVFPKTAPVVSNKKLYAMFTALTMNRPNNSMDCLIEAKLDKNCSTKRCAMISVFATRAQNAVIEKTYPIPPLDKQQTRDKIIVTLDNNAPAYFTPGHAEGTWFPPQLEWISNKVKYTLTWDGDTKYDAQELLIRMANSAYE